MIMFRFSNYYKTDSFIHEINPFLKLFITIIFILSVFLSKSVNSKIFLGFFLLIIIIASNVPILKYLKAIWKAKYFLVLFLLLDFIFYRSFNHLLITLILAISIVLMISVLVFTTKFHDLMTTFEIILTPLKLVGVNSKKIAFSIMMGFYFIPILSYECKNTIKAMHNQNPGRETIKNKIRNISNISTPVISKSINHVNRVVDVMSVRNCSFDKKVKYAIYVRKVDYALVAVQLLIFIAILVKG